MNPFCSRRQAIRLGKHAVERNVSGKERERELGKHVDRKRNVALCATTFVGNEVTSSEIMSRGTWLLGGMRTQTD